MKTKQIELSAPYIDEREEELVLEVLRSGWLSLGPVLTQFERMFAERLGVEHAAAVSSGTAGLHLAVKLAGIEAGDEVITTPFSFVASTNCFLYEGATPVFVDVDPQTLNMDPELVEAAITPRTKAIVAVDMFGYPCELDPLLEIAERHGLAFVEDSCEALGAGYRGRPVGSGGHLAVFAFYPNKQMTTGEGGIVVTDSEEEWKLLKSLSNQGRAEDGAWLDHVRLGYNYRLDDVGAALGVAQLEKLDHVLELRAQVAARYAELLAGIDGVEPLLADDADHKRSWFVYPVWLDASIDRLRTIQRLREQGVASKVYLPSIHQQSYIRERFDFRDGMFRNAEDASARLLALPFHTGLEADDQERVVEALRSSI